MTILLTGTDGQIGSILAAQLRERVPLAALNRHQLDISDAHSVHAACAAFRPTVIINAAAYTDVDAAEHAPDAAEAVNRHGAAHLAHAAQQLGASIVHLSSDYVFDGTGAPYGEHAAAQPCNAYGRSKLLGEHALAAACPRHLIIRTAWVFAPQRRNFAQAVLRRAASGKPVNVVDRQYGSPTPAAAVARAIVQLLPHLAADAPPYGIYHFGGQSSSRHQFAAALIAQARAQGLLPPDTPDPVAVADYPAAAPRPADTRLDCTRIQRTFGIAQADWRAAISDLSPYFP